uniref:CDC like kinase 4 n=1 Tax=Equus caballus TaxID=9796 RepID=A0A9L0SMQ7_HORSE
AGSAEITPPEGADTRHRLRAGHRLFSHGDKIHLRAAWTPPGLKRGRPGPRSRSVEGGPAPDVTRSPAPHWERRERARLCYAGAFARRRRRWKPSGGLKGDCAAAILWGVCRSGWREKTAVWRRFSAKRPFAFAEMRHSKRTHCPDWDSRESWGHESYGGSHKRKRRSHSSTQENRHCKPHHQFKDSDCHYLEARSLNERDYRDRRYVDEYRNDYCEGYIPRHYHRDVESSYRIHCSKSSVRSRRSSPKRKRNRHCSSHQSHSV